MERIIEESELKPDNLTILLRTKYNARNIAYYASNYGCVLNRRKGGKMSILNVQRNASKRTCPDALKHGRQNRPPHFINSSHAPVHNKSVYRIIAEAFFGEDAVRGKLIHHKDCNAANNRIDNLMIVTPKQHMQIHKQIRSGEIEITNLQKSLFYVTK